MIPTVANELNSDESLLIIAAVDVPYQMISFKNKLKMSIQEIKDEYKDLFNSKENTIPTDIQILINDREIGMAVLRLIEIIGQDKIEDLGSETLYFLINALNQMNIDPIRNEILYSVLPLRA